MATDQEAGTKQRRRAAVLGTAGAALAAVSVAHSAVSPITGISPLAPPLGACLGPQCPGTWSGPHNGDFDGRDEAINIFTGADFSATGSALVPALALSASALLVGAAVLVFTGRKKGTHA